GVPKDHAQAVAWYRKAAEQGDADAQFFLGIYYGERLHGLRSRDIRAYEDFKEALLWTRKAAEQGLAEAQDAMGLLCFLSGDSAQGVAWYRKAAEEGNKSAQLHLGELYAEGRKMDRDYVEAYKWLDLAASRASGEPYPGAAKSRDTVAKKMTSTQKAEAQQRAREWAEAFEKQRDK
ncbi:MAG: tetratricopeptide repeat protein, partial [Acidobacteriota bacterium]|nr:tetratricopeptide repeat protein [Acidobacteriota bacterium]